MIQHFTHVLYSGKLIKIERTEEGVAIGSMFITSYVNHPLSSKRKRIAKREATNDNIRQMASHGNPITFNIAYD